MKYEIAMKWVAELRSGKRQQYKSRLKTDKGLCCLGVLCEDVLGMVPKFDHDKYVFDGLGSTVPPSATIESGMYNCTGTPWTGKIIIDGKKYECLINANDDGVSFAKIADWIELNWERLYLLDITKAGLRSRSWNANAAGDRCQSA